MKSALLGTLLHELCHACSDFWSCDEQDDCESEQGCRDVHLQQMGIDSHGKGWFFLAAYVEVVARRLFPELDLRLGAVDGAKDECNVDEDRVSIPDIAEWSRILRDLDEKDIDGLLRSSDAASRKRLFKMAGWEHDIDGHYNDNAAHVRNWVEKRGQERRDLEKSILDD